MTRVVVTGGAGYIGSVLTEILLKHDFHVTVVDNFMWRQTSLAHLCTTYSGRLDTVRGDARDMRIMKPLLQSTDIFIPLAALVGADLCAANVLDARSTNVDAIADSMLLLSPQQRTVIPITNSGYGIGAKDAYCDESSPLRPISVYGQTKVQAEKIALDHGSAISLRLATVFGMSARMRFDLLVNDFVWRAVRDRALVLFEGEFRRNFIHVRDVANAFAFAIGNWEQMIKTPVYNVGLSSANMTKFDLCCMIQEYLPDFRFVEGAGSDPDKRDYIVSNKRLEAKGWEAYHTLPMGIKELITGYQMYRRHEYGNV